MNADYIYASVVLSRWHRIQRNLIHVRHSVFAGHLGTPKSEASVAPLPMPIDLAHRLKAFLVPDSLEFIQTGKAKKPLQIRVPAGSLIGIHSSLLCATNPWPAYVMETLQFDRSLKSFGGPREKRVCAKMTVPQLLTLLRYISEHRGKATQAGNAPSPGRETAEQPQGLRASSGAKARDASPCR